ncbi:MAG: hypothetical protein M3033_09390 [Acidobacteriota bacterium]|nr:hypothetical protein [Acidobacteriota bacterium]
MEFEFDKEIDSLLRQTAQGETAFAANNPQSEIRNSHLDADQISAFAENALPEKTKSLYTKHFADCDRCRKILSNVILLNVETASESVRMPQTEKVAAVLPWYRRLFATPNLAYAMGALVLVFAGLIAFMFLKTAPQNSEVSQMREVPINMQGASSDGETRTIESNASMSNSSTSSMSNGSAMMSKNLAANSAVVSAPNAPAVSNSAANANKQSAAKDETKQSEQLRESNSALAKKDKNEMQVSAGSIAVEKTETKAQDNKSSKEDNNDAVRAEAPAPKSMLTQPNPAELPINGRSTVMSDAPAATEKKKSSPNSETKTIAGKTFRRDGGVWYDASYSGQSTTNVRRGTGDYKKLDAGLRSIADAFGGTVVVVWKAKAYRIQ